MAPPTPPRPDSTALPVRRSDSALATVLLTSRLVPRDEKPLTPSEFWSLLDSVEDPAKLLDDAAEVEPKVRALLEAGTALAIRLSELERSGITVQTPFDEGYPQRLRARLGNAAPALLYVAGPVELLAEDGIGIVGSRDVVDDAREAASQIAKLAVSKGWSVVSGVARGIDQVAMSSALESGGTVVGLPADALAKLVKDPSVRRAITDGSMVLATPYAPTAGFSVGTAMARNKLIYALSRATVVVSSDFEKGGTWSGATEALEKGYGTVAVWVGEGAGEGNAHLVARGAIPISDPSEVAALEPMQPSGPAPSEQMRLL